MAEVIRMPRLSDTMEEGIIVGWLKKEGDMIEPGDVLAEVETDKATMELDSYQEGVLLHINVKEGPVPVDSIIAVIGEEGEDYEHLLEESSDEKKEDTSKEQAEEQSAKDIETSKEKSPEPSSSKTEEGRIKASPLAKKIASEKGIDLQNISGTGDGGRIVKRDVEEAAEKGVSAPKAAPAAARLSLGAEDQSIPLTQIGRASCREQERSMVRDRYIERR